MSKNKINEHRVCEITLDGDVKKVECNVCWTIVTDPNYGADADGNRGTCMEFIDEVILTNVVISGQQYSDDKLPERIQELIIKTLDEPKEVSQ